MRCDHATRIPGSAFVTVGTVVYTARTIQSVAREGTGGTNKEEENDKDHWQLLGEIYPTFN